MIAEHGHGPVYLLLAGQYADTEILGVTFATTQAEADRTARVLTRDRQALYGTAPKWGKVPDDLITVRAEPVGIITPSGEFLR